MVLGFLKEVVTSNMGLWKEQLVERCVLLSCPVKRGRWTGWSGCTPSKTVALIATKATGSHLLDIDTAVLYTKQDFNYKLEAVWGLVQSMKVKFIMGSGHVARIYYYYVGHCVAQRV